MVSKTLPDSAEQPWPGSRLDFAEFAARLAARREALGNPELPRNSGSRRTVSKRALLEAIETAGGKC